MRHRGPGPLGCLALALFVGLALAVVAVVVAVLLLGAPGSRDDALPPSHVDAAAVDAGRWGS